MGRPIRDEVRLVSGRRGRTGAGPRPLSWEQWLSSNNTCGDGSTHKVYENYEPVLDFDAPVGVDKSYSTANEPSDLAVVDDATDRVYRYVNNTAVTPSSFARVKALFQ